MMTIMMTRSSGRVEDLQTRDNLVRVLYLTNKKSGTRPMNFSQCGAVANNIIAGKVTTFCGRHFEVTM